MAERGLIFCGQLMPPLLSGAKKRTMRLVARHNSLVDGHAAGKELWAQLRFAEAWVDPGPSPMGNAGPYLKVPRTADGDEYVHRVYPRVRKGDVIWSRETFMDNCEPGHGVDYENDDGDLCSFTYAANGKPKIYDNIPWKSPLFQPRIAARFVSPPLTAVFPQRPRDLDDAECLAEGVEIRGKFTPRDMFQLLWMEINGGNSWKANPWCFVYQWA